MINGKLKKTRYKYKQQHILDNIKNYPEFKNIKKVFDLIKVDFSEYLYVVDTMNIQNMEFFPYIDRDLNFQTHDKLNKPIFYNKTSKIKYIECYNFEDCDTIEELKEELSNFGHSDIKLGRFSRKLINSLELESYGRTSNTILGIFIFEIYENNV